MAWTIFWCTTWCIPTDCIYLLWFALPDLLASNSGSLGSSSCLPASRPPLGQFLVYRKLTLILPFPSSFQVFVYSPFYFLAILSFARFPHFPETGLHLYHVTPLPSSPPIATLKMFSRASSLVHLPLKPHPPITHDDRMVSRYRKLASYRRSPQEDRLEPVVRSMDVNASISNR